MAVLRKCGVSFLAYLGYTRTNFKPDPDESILTLKESIKREWEGDIIPEESPVT